MIILVTKIWFFANFLPFFLLSFIFVSDSVPPPSFGGGVKKEGTCPPPRWPRYGPIKNFQLLVDRSKHYGSYSWMNITVTYFWINTSGTFLKWEFLEHFLEWEFLEHILDTEETIFDKFSQSMCHSKALYFMQLCIILLDKVVTSMSPKQKKLHLEITEI